MSKAVAFGRPIATTPGVPVERVAALRRAFDLTLKDPAFLQEAKTQRAELQPMTGAELEGIVADVIGSPLELRERVRRAIQPANAKEIPGKPGGNE
jgi:tripartite-type tricarboxylate transporter receptor subunit TctC